MLKGTIVSIIKKRISKPKPVMKALVAELLKYGASHLNSAQKAISQIYYQLPDDHCQKNKQITLF